ncbi:cbb3-type cytochrome oxidase assembly protein CcoS [uncultured Helicobacter sp.]|uniref:cbb3-type cytochrome oxidase assembly protein CcoS n=1 Tax=uncultured Helicobacter sp. TaxID=175537 RepID=UPI001C39C4B6|nr:cbb3-type cytochrome oxidase assembly protein CcoS [Candidatus Helicobacter avicola]
MSVEIVAFMLGISLILGFFGLLGFLWGLKNGQFDDENKMMEGVLFDTPEDLNKIANQHQKHDFLQDIDSQTTKPQSKSE